MDRTDKYAFKNREGTPNIPQRVLAAASTIVPYPRPLPFPATGSRDLAASLRGPGARLRLGA